MPDAATSPVSDSPPRRPWYRLHLSTWLILALTAAVLVLLIVPGECPRVTRHLYYSHGLLSLEFDHGWPWEYLVRYDDARETPPRVPWFGRPGWCLAGETVGFSFVWLALDTLTALLILFAIGVAFEWRRRRRRLCQFTLRELIALTMVLAIALSWWSSQRARFDRERQIAEQVESIESEVEVVCFWEYSGPACLVKLVGPREFGCLRTVRGVVVDARSAVAGGNARCRGEVETVVTKTASLPNLRWLQLIAAVVSEQEVAGLAAARHLEHLDLSGAVSSEALAALAESKSLRRLTLHGEITREALRSLGLLSRLESLTLTYVPLDDESLQYVVGLKGLRVLDLQGAGIRGAGLLRLRELPNLETLFVRDTHVGDESAAAIAALTNLRVLFLYGTEITDAGIAHLAALTKLEELDLPRGATDTSLEYLRHLPRLKELYVYDTHVTAAGIRRFQEAKPDCRIIGQPAGESEVPESADQAKQDD